MAAIVFMDLETFSPVDLIKHGVFRYAADPDADVICGVFAEKYHGKEPTIEGFKYDAIPSSELFEILFNCGTVISHNIEFDLEIYNKILVKKYQFPVFKKRQQMICTLKRQAFLGLPRSLKNASACFNLKEQKSARGAELVRLLSVPDENGNRRYDPELENEMYDYCLQDIKTTIDLFNAQNNLLTALDSFHPKKWDILAQQLDTRINMTGVPVNVELAEALFYRRNQEIAMAQLEAIKFCDDWNLPNLSQVAKLKEYIQNNFNYKIESFSHIPADAPEDVKKLLSIRDKAAQSSLAKAEEVLDKQVDGRLYGLFNYYGAHTGRFAGKDFQIQNLPRTSDPSEPQSFLRNIISTYKDHSLIFADYAGIEHRLLFYIANKFCEEKNFQCANTKNHLDKIRKNEEPYLELAAEIYGLPLQSLTKTSPERMLGKRAHLGLGYMMGAYTFLQDCLENEVYIDLEMAKNTVDIYRNKYKAIVKMWNYLNENFLQVATKNENCRVPLFMGMSISLTNVETLEGINRIMTLVLPSGRPLFYHNFKTVTGKFGLVASYDGKKGVETLFGGKIAENIIQAISRDLLIYHMLEIEPKIKDARIVGHIHDEVLIETHDNSIDLNRGAVNAIMTSPPDWLPQMPLAIETTVSKYYKK
jgi:DNA polymerase